MIKAVLDPSQARPAGVTIQATTAVTATGEATLISARNADFTPNSNVIADAFWYIVNDTSAATQALSAPYGALDGLCSSSQVTGTSTRCTLDSGDAVTNALGNAAGPTVTFTAPSTGHVIAWTADQGTFWINGTSSGFEFTASVAAQLLEALLLQLLQVRLIKLHNPILVTSQLWITSQLLMVSVLIREQAELLQQH
jgi:hypothetical protein